MNIIDKFGVEYSEDMKTLIKAPEDLAGEYVIPEGVEKIENRSFRGCESLTFVTIPNSVTEIGEGAFYGCKSLMDVVLPKNLTYIDKETFYGCEHFSNWEAIPDSVTYFGMNAFYRCAFQSITINQANYHKECWRAFTECNALRDVYIGDNVENFSIGCIYPYRGSETPNAIRFHFPTNAEILLPITKEYWELDCKDNRDREDISIKSGYAEEYWWKCIEATSIEIKASVAHVSMYNAWDDKCTYYKVYLKELKSIGSWAYDDDSFERDSDIIIPESVEIIEDGAFENIGYIKEVILENIKIIGNGAFENCQSLESITLFDNVTEIGRSAFESCSSLEDIHYLGTKAQWANIEFGEKWNNDTPAKVVHCTDGDVKI